MKLATIGLSGHLKLQWIVQLWYINNYDKNCGRFFEQIFHSLLPLSYLNMLVDVVRVPIKKINFIIHDRSSCFSYWQGKSWFEMDAIFFIPVVRGAANIVDCYLIVSNYTESSVFALKLSQHDLIFFYKCKTNGWAEKKECEKNRQFSTWKEAMLFQVN